MSDVAGKLEAIDRPLRPVEAEVASSATKAIAREAQLARAEGPELELTSAPAPARPRGRGRPARPTRRRPRGRG